MGGSFADASQTNISPKRELFSIWLHWVLDVDAGMRHDRSA
jgi:hypothetical protein